MEIKFKNCDCQNEKLEKELQELQEVVDTKMAQQISIHDRMVINYEKMVEKCKEYEKNIMQMRTENDHIKLIAEYLMRKAEELIGCNSIEERITDSDAFNDNALFLKVSHTLIQILIIFPRLKSNHERIIIISYC